MAISLLHTWQGGREVDLFCAMVGDYCSNRMVVLCFDKDTTGEAVMAG